MKGNRAVIIAIVVIVAIAVGWLILRRGTGTSAIDLIAQFGVAEKRPDPGLFSVGDVTLNGDARPAISVKPAVGTRLIYKVMVPHDGRLSVAVGLREEAWKQEGNGVLFQVGVSDGRRYEPLFSQHVHPYANQGDRKWVQSIVDLSPYSGDEVQLIFNTYSSPNSQPPDERGDLAVWGRPEIVVR